MSADKTIHKSEIAIIGGGIIGCFIAYYLAKQGKDVVVLEGEEIGSGASGANDACLMSQSKKPGPKLSLAIESADMWAGMSDELAYDIEYCRHGSMIICETEEQTGKMRDFSQAQIDFGLPVEILDYRQTHEFQPALSTHVLSSSYCMLDGECRPLSSSRLTAQICIKSLIPISAASPLALPCILFNF